MTVDGKEMLVQGSGTAWQGKFVTDQKIQEGNLNISIVLTDLAGNTSSSYTETTDSSKVVFDKNENLLYASRSPIPFTNSNKLSKSWRQVLVYSFPRLEILKFYKIKKKNILTPRGYRVARARAGASVRAQLGTLVFESCTCVLVSLFACVFIFSRRFPVVVAS